VGVRRCCAQNQPAGFMLSAPSFPRSCINPTPPHPNPKSPHAPHLREGAIHRARLGVHVVCLCRRLTDALHRRGAQRAGEEEVQIEQEGQLVPAGWANQRRGGVGKQGSRWATEESGAGAGEAPTKLQVGQYEHQHATQTLHLTW